MAMAIATRRKLLLGGEGAAGAAESMSMADVTTRAAVTAQAAAADEVARR